MSGGGETWEQTIDSSKFIFNILDIFISGFVAGKYYSAASEKNGKVLLKHIHRIWFLFHTKWQRESGITGFWSTILWHCDCIDWPTNHRHGRWPYCTGSPEWQTAAISFAKVTINVIWYGCHGKFSRSKTASLKWEEKQFVERKYFGCNAY